MAKTSKKQLAAVAKYNKEHVHRIMLALNKKTDADIIEWLNSMQNKQGYIKDLIRIDILEAEEVEKNE